MPLKRRSNVTAKFNKMRGLEPDEKRVFTRIGELVDAVINNRAPTNAGSQQNRIITRTDVSLPPVKNLVAKSGIRSAKLEWEPITSNFLQFYEVQLNELANGDQTTAIAYTNSFTIKDRVGQFAASVRSVGRDGTASVFNTIQFEIQPNVLIYNGEKNAVDVVGYNQQVPLYSPKGYNIYFWGAIVLDSFAHSPQFNYEPVYTLSVFNAFYQGGDFYSPSTFYLFPGFIQQINTPPEETTFTNLSVSAGGGSTHRPGGSPTRTANYQTSMAIPFAPYTVPDLLANRTNIYWISEGHRDDIVGMALNAWVTTAGLSEISIPGPVINCLGNTEQNLYYAVEPRIASVSEPIDFTNPSGITCMAWVKNTGIRYDEFLQLIPAGLNFSWNSTGGDLPVGFRWSAYTAHQSVDTQWNNTSFNPPDMLDFSFHVWHLLTFRAEINEPSLSQPVVDSTFSWFVDGKFYTSLQRTNIYPLNPVNTRVKIFLEGLSRWYWLAVWNKVLTNEEIRYLYSGVPTTDWVTFDLTTNRETYNSANELVHWWRPGDGDIGDDEIFPGAQLVDIDVIIEENIIYDFPGGPFYI